MDLRARTPKLPSPNNKVRATELITSEGGVTANNLVQTTRLGLNTAWTGILGEDNWAPHLEKKFREESIHSQAIIAEGAPTQQFWIITDPKGEWHMVGIPGAVQKLTNEQVRENFTSLINQAKHFHTEVAAIPLAAALEGAKVAKEHSIKVLLDIDDDPWYLTEKEGLGTGKELQELLRCTNVAKLSLSAALGLTKKDSFSETLLKEILAFGPELVVVTDAEKGCYIGTKDQKIHCLGFSVETIDTVGAGDAFMGGFSYGLLQNWPLEEIGRFANACGAFKCTRFGARSSGTLAQINDFLRNYGKS